MVSVTRLISMISLLAGLYFASPFPTSAAEPPGVKQPVDFLRDVAPVLTKLGCNAGTCHGSFQGRGGFRLSLLGFDPDFDFAALTKEGRGRRLSLTAPLNSLLLTKPLGRVPHGGGRRLEQNSDAFRILSDWLTSGARGPTDGGSEIAAIEVTPQDLLLKPGNTTQLHVRARWSDGVERDVNDWALFDVGDESVIQVGTTGHIEAIGPGRTSVAVRYLGQVDAVTVTIPYGEPLTDTAWPAWNFIDEHVSREWRRLGSKPAALSTDAEFLRRVSLDITGTLPAPEEVRAFLDSDNPDKRTKLIDTLLERPAYVDYWSLQWSNLLRGHRRFLGDKGLWSFYGWIREQVRSNRPADAMVRELLTARGNLYGNGAVAFYFVDQTPLDLAETTAQVFLGVRLQCARCHHHPFEVWSQEDFYGLASFFTRVERKDSGENGLLGGTQSVQLAETGSINHPVSGLPVAPRLFGAAAQVDPESDDVRTELAAWVTADTNPYFARSLVNRYWHHFFGRGLVDPVDDLRGTNPPSHPELFAALAADLVAHHYDLKHLIRTICTSRTYHLASETAPQRDTDGMFYTHFTPRRLTAEVLLDAINTAAGTQEQFQGLTPGFRAITLPDSDVPSFFLDTFGRSQRTSTCTCGSTDKADLKQILHLVNGETLQARVTSKDGRVAKLVESQMSDSAVVEELYLATLSRLPTPDETARSLELTATAPSRQEGFEDLLWTLLNCAEFSFQH